MKTKKPTTADKSKPIITIVDAEQLTALINAPVFCTFNLDGQSIRIPCHRMTPATAEQVRAIRRKPQPPFMKERGQTGDYDHTNAAYMAARDLAEFASRAVVIYAHCPTVSKAKPGLTVQEDILRHVQSMFTENILEMISLTIQGGGMELEDRANFTSTPASES